MQLINYIAYDPPACNGKRGDVAGDTCGTGNVCRGVLCRHAQYSGRQHGNMSAVAQHVGTVATVGMDHQPDIHDRADGDTLSCQQRVQFRARLRHGSDRHVHNHGLVKHMDIRNAVIDPSARACQPDLSACAVRLLPQAKLGTGTVCHSHNPVARLDDPVRVHLHDARLPDRGDASEMLQFQRLYSVSDGHCRAILGRSRTRHHPPWLVHYADVHQPFRRLRHKKRTIHRACQRSTDRADRFPAFAQQHSQTLRRQHTAAAMQHGDQRARPRVRRLYGDRLQQHGGLHGHGLHDHRHTACEHVRALEHPARLAMAFRPLAGLRARIPADGILLDHLTEHTT